MKIAILSTNEKIYSTNRLLEAINKKGYEGEVINHTKCHVGMEKGNPQVFYRGKALPFYDAVIPRIGSSVTFYGTAVVRQFEMLDTFCANGSEGILQSRDKLRSMQLMSRTGIGIPKTMFAKFPKDKEVDMLIDELGGTPVVIKLLEGTQGLGVVLADTKQAAKSTIEAFSGMKANILIQEFIKEAGGADIRAFVVGGKVIGAMRRQGKEDEFRSNLHRGGRSSKIKLTPIQEETAVKAVAAMGLHVAGVDILEAQRGPLVLEVNSSPGLEGIEKITGNDIAGKIIDFIAQKVEEKRKQSEKTTIDKYSN